MSGSINDRSSVIRTISVIASDVRILNNVISEFITIDKQTVKDKMSTHISFTWYRFGGYEVSSKADSRFSALNAIIPDGRSIEQHHQCDIKQYDVGGTNWKIGKGRPPLNASINLLSEYVSLWRVWVSNNLPLMRELYIQAVKHNYILSDRFASTEVNQANALSIILNELCNRE